MTELTDIINNVVDNDIRCNASTFVSDVIGGSIQIPPSEHDELMEAMSRIDYEEAVRRYVDDAHPEELRELVEDCDYGRTQLTEDDPEDLEDQELRQQVAQTLNSMDGAQFRMIAYKGDIRTGGQEREALQHWIVSDRLAEYLAEIDEPIAIDVCGWNIWGRTEGGSLKDDGALRRVAQLIRRKVKEATQ